MKSASQRKAAVGAEAGTSPQHLEAALAHVSDAAITTDAANQIVYMNAAAEALTGWVARDAVGVDLAAVFNVAHAETGATIEHGIKAARQSDDDTTPSVQRSVLVGQSTRPLVIEYTISLMWDEEGLFAGVVIVFRDITHRREAELALQTNEEILLANAEALFEEKERAQVTLSAIGDAVASIDFRGRVNFLNRVAEKMTGWTQEEAEGRHVDEVFFLVDSATREQTPCPTMSAIIENRTVSVESPCVLIRRDGGEIAIEDSASPIHDKNGGVIGAVMVAHDVTASRELSDRLARLALYDNLTELPNRTLFADRVAQALARADRSGGAVGLLFLDLNRFKPVNDSLGHEVGDQLLQSVARRLLACVRASDTVSRLGGDEFVILLAGIETPHDAEVCASKIEHAMQASYEIGKHRLDISASIGISIYPQDATDSATLIRYADIAMYQAKEAGLNRFQCFNLKMLAQAD